MGPADSIIRPDQNHAFAPFINQSARWDESQQRWINSDNGKPLSDILDDAARRRYSEEQVARAEAIVEEGWWRLDFARTVLALIAGVVLVGAAAYVYSSMHTAANVTPSVQITSAPGVVGDGVVWTAVPASELSPNWRDCNHGLSADGSWFEWCRTVTQNLYVYRIWLTEDIASFDFRTKRPDQYPRGPGSGKPTSQCATLLGPVHDLPSSQAPWWAPRNLVQRDHNFAAA